MSRLNGHMMAAKSHDEHDGTFGGVTPIYRNRARVATDDGRVLHVETLAFDVSERYVDDPVGKNGWNIVGEWQDILVLARYTN